MTNFIVNVQILLESINLYCLPTVERLWQSLKYEEVYLKAYTTPHEAELEISHYVVFYNEERNHQELNDLTPDEAYFGRQRYAA